MRSSAPRRSVALLVAVTAAVLVVVLWVAFVLTPQGQRLDAAAYGGAGWARVGPWELVDAARGRLVLPAALATVAVVLGWLAVSRQWRQAVAAVVVVLGATLSIQLLKHQVLLRPDFGFPPDPNSLPSGHVGATATAGVVLLLAAPAAWRTPVAFAGSWVTAVVGVSTVVGFQHRPSDVVAAVLVVFAWAAGATILLERDGPGRPAAGPAGLAVLLTPGAVLALPASASVMLAVLQPDRPVGPLEALVALLGAFAAIVATSSLAFAAVLALLPRAVGPGPRNGRPGRLRRPLVPRAPGPAVRRRDPV